VSTLDITALRSLAAVSSFAGVARAADALHLSQPTVTGHLRRLEAELGVPLVTRQGRAIAFTMAGEELVRRAHRILSLHDDAVDALTGGERDDLVVACSDLAAAPLLRVAAEALRAHVPERRIRFRFHRSERLREFAHAHSADVILGFAPLGPATRTVGEAELGWFAAEAPTRQSGVRHGIVGPGQAEDGLPDADGLVLFTRPCTLRETIEDAVAGVGVPVARECLDLAGVLAAVRQGVGITALPLTTHPEQGLRRIEGPAPLPTLRMTAVFSPRLGAASEPILAALREAAAAVHPAHS